MGANITVNSQDECNRWDWHNGQIKDGMLCAGPMLDNSNGCIGIPGASLQCDGNLVGIMSNGKDCGHPNLPAVYANVYYYLDWINEHL